MQTLNHGYRGLSLLMRLNLDRVLCGGALAAALWAGAWVGTL
ncbi:MAG: hypothetical protein AAF218_02390 [Pseudomonadota bacterium]